MRTRIEALAGGRALRAVRRRGFALTALYIAAALVAVAPAIPQIGSAFIADQDEARPGFGEAASGDHLQSVYRFWLTGHQLERGAAPWIDPYSFQPLVEPQPALGGWPFGLPFWPLEAVGGPVIAWNVLLLAGIVLAGLVTCAWLAALGLGTLAAAAGGLAFAIAPYRLAQSGGHLVGWMAIFLPLALWAYERSRGEPPGRRRHLFGALAALAVVSLPLSGQLQLALGAIAFLVFYVAVRFGRAPALWLGAGMLVAVGVGVAIDWLVVSGSIASEGRTLAEVGYYSADWIDLVSRDRQRGVEQFVYIGWVTPALALIGVVLLARRSRGLAAVLGLAVLVPLVLALGTHLPLYEWLRDVFPPLRYPRVPSRFAPVAVLALAALAAFGVVWVVAKLGSRRWLAGSIVIALIAADLLVFPLRSSDADPGNGAYAQLAEKPAGRLLELPIVTGIVGQYGSVYQYYVMQAPRERPSGYSSVAPIATKELPATLGGLTCGDWPPDGQDELDRLGVRYLLFHGGVYRQAQLPGAWFAWRELQDRGYRSVAGDSGISLLQLMSAPMQAPPVAEPDRADPVLCRGWAGERMLATGASLWLWGEGDAVLRLDADEPTGVTARSDDGEPSAPVRLDGEGELTVELGEPGWHLVRLETTRPGVVFEEAVLEGRTPAGQGTRSTR